jgi:hypothetical protein
VSSPDPRNPTHIDEYTYAGGEVSEPKPISMTSSDLRELDSKLFDVNAIDYGKVPFMVQDTLNVTSVEDGKVISLFIEMGGKESFIRVYVTGPRVTAGADERLRNIDFRVRGHSIHRCDSMSASPASAAVLETSTSQRAALGAHDAK